jgi:uncharacterized delta-60 repeat protein
MSRLRRFVQTCHQLFSSNSVSPSVASASSKHRGHRQRSKVSRFERLEGRAVMAAGALDTSFSSDGKTLTGFGDDDVGRDVAVQTDGKIVVVGKAKVGGDYDFAVTRYNNNGSLDTSFSSDGKTTIDFGSGRNDTGISVIIVGGKIVIAGESVDSAGKSDFAIVRLNSNGSLDTSFSSDGKVRIGWGDDDRGRSIVEWPSGGYMVAGYAKIGGDQDFAFARLNSNGSLNTSFSSDGKQTIDFGSGANDLAQAVEVDIFNRIVAAGTSKSATSGKGDFAVVRLNSNGTLDTSFSSDGKTKVGFGDNDEAFDLTLRGTDMYVSGKAKIGNDYDFAVINLNTNGSLDTSFSSDGKQTIDFQSEDDVGYALRVDELGKVYIAGSARIGSDVDFAVVRLKANGTLDTTFSSDGKQTTHFTGAWDYGQGLTFDNLGRIVVAGVSRKGGSTAKGDFAVARYLVS